jgi:hypothetical protein
MKPVNPVPPQASIATGQTIWQRLRSAEHNINPLELVADLKADLLNAQDDLKEARQVLAALGPALSQLIALVTPLLPPGVTLPVELSQIAVKLTEIGN